MPVRVINHHHHNLQMQSGTSWLKSAGAKAKEAVVSAKAKEQARRECIGVLASRPSKIPRQAGGIMATLTRYLNTTVSGPAIQNHTEPRGELKRRSAAIRRPCLVSHAVQVLDDHALISTVPSRT